MYRALHLSPMVPSRDSAATVKFLEDALGFNSQHFGGGYAICERDGLTVHLQPMGEGAGQQSIYLEVDDVNALWTRLEPFLEGIRHKPPHDREYGMREIHFDLPHTDVLVFVGQII